MDFQDILAQASHNAQKATKLVKTFDQESNDQRIRRRQQYEQELAREREERKRKAPPKVEKKFVIPKKKAASEIDVDSQAVQNFMQRQRKEQNEKEIQKKKDRDKLIGLRLQANQGKASKKIASHFGKSAIELQQKYAPNSHMEMELLKRQQREQEELEKSSSSLRESIDRAKKDRAAILARTQNQNNGKPREKARIGNVKAGGFADSTSKQEEILTKRKAENFSTFASNREKIKKPKPRPQNGSASTLNFSDLMAQAQQNTSAGNAAAKTEQILRTGHSASTQPNSREVMKRAMVEQSLKKKPVLPSSSSSKPAPQSQSGSSRNGSSNSAVKRPAKVENPYALSDRQVLGPPQAQQSQREVQQKKPQSYTDRSVPPFPQQPKKEQRFLPGDIRYKGPPPSSSRQQSSSSSSQRPSADAFNSTFGLSSSNKEKRPNQSYQSPARHPKDSFKRPMSPDRRQQSQQRYDRPSSSRKPEKYQESRPRSNPAMFGKRPGNVSSSYSNGYDEYDNEDEYDDEDEYDSEMDDFIDDSQIEELEAADFEESLRSINRNYDKKRWKMNERMIDERRMQANYRDIEAEERKSSKMGLMEDIREAMKGSKGLA